MIRSMLRRTGAGQKPFIIQVKTDNIGTSNDDQFILPINVLAGIYNYDVKTSDGQTFLNRNQADGNLTITFPSIGTYTIEIYGLFPSIYFNLELDRQKLVDILQWGDIEWLDFQNSFKGCSQLTTVTPSDLPNLLNVTNMLGAFQGCTLMTSLNVTNWNVSNITSLRLTFQGCSVLNTLDVSNWNTQNVTDFEDCFRISKNVNYDVTNWDMSSAISVRNMFRDCDIFNRNLSSWNIVNITDFREFMNFATGLSTANYDATLIGWEATLQAAFPSGVGYTAPLGPVHFGGSKYTLGSAAETARTSLISTFGWTITDGGGI